MLPMYLRSSRRYRLDYISDEWEHAPLATRPISELYRRHACEIELESRRGMTAIKTGMTNVAGHFCSHIGTVSQAVLAAMLQVHRRHMRTRLNVRSNLRRYTKLSDPARNPATTPTCSHFSWYTSHWDHLGQWKYKNKEQQQFARNESERM